MYMRQVALANSVRILNNPYFSQHVQVDCLLNVEFCSLLPHDIITPMIPAGLGCPGACLVAIDRNHFDGQAPR
jgi:hypothetical protein